MERRSFGPPGRAPCPRWAVGRARGRGALVDRSVDLVRVMTACQFALDVAPLRSRKREGGRRVRGGGSLREFAEAIGLSFHTVCTYRWVAARWPEDQRQEEEFSEVHRILAAAPNAYELIKSPPATGGRAAASGAGTRRSGPRAGRPRRR